MITVIAEKCDEGQRLDSFVASCEDFSLSRNAAVLQIEHQTLLVNDKPAVKKQTVKDGDIVTFQPPEPVDVNITAEDIPIDIIYEDADIAVINKPKGMVVHPAPGHYSGTLVNALLYRLKDLSGINGELRPGIVHRLDRYTSGLIVAAKNDAAHRALADQFRLHTNEKYYLAIAEGNFTADDGIIGQPIARCERDRKKMAVASGGRPAITSWKVLERFGTATLLECRIFTGRTHQIRVHLAHIGHPCLCDPLYGIKKQRFSFEGQLLHSAKLVINQPTTGERMTFTAQPPQDFNQALMLLRKGVK